MPYPWPIDLLGLALNDPRVTAELQQHGIRPPAPTAMAADDLPDLWLQATAAGMEFDFESSAKLDAGETDRPAVLRLSQVYFYGRHPNMIAYSGVLPFGLSMSDNRTAVRMKLAVTGAACRPYRRDAFDLGISTLVVAYGANGADIDFLLFLLAARPPEQSSRQQQPTLEAILALFGKPLTDAAVARNLAHLNWPARSDAVRHGGLVSLRRSHGIDVIGRAPFIMRPRPETPSAATNVLTEVVLYRPGALGSAGWRGDLPFDLHWNDGPEELSRKVPQPAHGTHEDDFSGWTLRHEAAFSAQVHYSTMENFIVRVRVMAPGVWERLASA